jgi:hypothetical protein
MLKVHAKKNDKTLFEKKIKIWPRPDFNKVKLTLTSVVTSCSHIYDVGT